MSKTFFKHNQPTNTSVAILERMNALKANVVINNIFKRMGAV